MLYKTIDIGGNTYKMCAAASVNIVYQNIFNEDFLIKLNTEHPESSIMPFMQMAFVMAKVGELGRKQANTLTKEDYEEWLDEFTFSDLIAAMEDIQTLYLQSSSGTLDSKKNKSELNAN